MKNRKISRVLLIRPAPLNRQFGGESFLPLGIAYIAAVLEKNGYTVKVMDLVVQKTGNEEMYRMISEFDPDVTGFSAVTPAVNGAYAMAKKLKEKNPEMITIIGGPHCTAMPEECLQKNIDFVMLGESEETIIEFLENTGDPSRVAGIAYRKDGETVYTAPRNYIKDLDSIPFPARHLFPPLSFYKGQEALGSRTPVGSIITSRGCPYSCNFCFKAVFGNIFRARSAENVVAEWEYLVKELKVKEIAIVDDCFTTDIGRVHRICDEIIKRKLKVRWCCPNGIRVDLGDLDMLKKMKKAGCYRVALGIESGSQKVLDAIGKHITLERIEQTVINCRKAGIKTMGFYMLGNLCETRQTMEETIRFAKRVMTDYAQFLIALPYPGSGLYNEIARNGRLLLTDWDQYGQYEGLASFEYGEITPALLEEMGRKARKEYYFSARYLFNQVFNSETYRYLPQRIKTVLNLLTKGKV
jgi:anaerobic magnesium-protoporphyrin IX monomethyl ester cyclase